MTSSSTPPDYESLYQSLQSEFDNFRSESAELESELEAEAKAEKQNRENLSKQFEILRKSHDELKQQHSTTENLLRLANEKIFFLHSEILEKEKIFLTQKKQISQLESENEQFQSKIRIFESIQENLREELEESQEMNILLREEMENSMEKSMEIQEKLKKQLNSAIQENEIMNERNNNNKKNNNNDFINNNNDNNNENNFSVDYENSVGEELKFELIRLQEENSLLKMKTREMEFKLNKFDEKSNSRRNSIAAAVSELRRGSDATAEIGKFLPPIKSRSRANSRATSPIIETESNL